jgi:hypothetical protein
MVSSARAAPTDSAKLAKVAKRTLRIISTSSQKWPRGFSALPALGSGRRLREALLEW